MAMSATPRLVVSVGSQGLPRVVEDEGIVGRPQQPAAFALIGAALLFGASGLVLPCPDGRRVGCPLRLILGSSRSSSSCKRQYMQQQLTRNKHVFLSLY
jgi:hypothetical protein